MRVFTQSRTQELLPAYSVEVDTIDEAGWHGLLATFDDANIYQTWSYDEVRGGRKQISHLVLKKNENVVAIAQARLVKLPLINVGVAYVRWGPLWRCGSERDLENFRQSLRALRNEYACRRGLVLRVYPPLYPEDGGVLASILGEEGFSLLTTAKPDRTLLLDLTRPLNELRHGLRPHWQRYLKVAERNGLEVIEGDGDELFAAFIQIYREMVSRKAFAQPNDINEFRLIQRRLPAELRMKVMLCSSEGQVVAGLVCSAIGKTGVYLFGATSNAGLKARGSYLLHWKLIEWLKAKGCSAYDLNGINPLTNPGTYKFKSDLCGCNGRDVYFLGRFDACTSAISQACVAGGDQLRMMYRSLSSNARTRLKKVTAASPAGAVSAQAENCEESRVLPAPGNLQ
jgi:hypothetical protein